MTLDLPGSTGMKSLIGLPNTHMAGDSLVSGSGVFLYCRIALWRALVSSPPPGNVLEQIKRLTVFTPTSALQLECGNATEDFLWCTPQVLRKCFVSEAMNSGPPSDESSFGIPNVPNVRLSESISPLAPSFALSLSICLLWLDDCFLYS